MTTLLLAQAALALLWLDGWPMRNVSEQPDPFHVGDYEMELVPCSATIAGTWCCMTTLLLASAALALLWLDGWLMRECK